MAGCKGNPSCCSPYAERGRFIDWTRQRQGSILEIDLPSLSHRRRRKGGIGSGKSIWEMRRWVSTRHLTSIFFFMIDIYSNTTSALTLFSCVCVCVCVSIDLFDTLPNLPLSFLTRQINCPIN